jgi:hypothetical protein
MRDVRIKTATFALFTSMSRQTKLRPSSGVAVTCGTRELMVEQRGIEPLTSALRTRRSAKLSYCPTHERRRHARDLSIFACGTHENTVSSFRFQVAGIQIRALIKFGELGMVRAAIVWKRDPLDWKATSLSGYESLTPHSNRDRCAPLNNHC